MTLLLSAQRAEGLFSNNKISSLETKVSFSPLNFPHLKIADILEHHSNQRIQRRFLIKQTKGKQSKANRAAKCKGPLPPLGFQRVTQPCCTVHIDPHANLCL